MISFLLNTKHMKKDILKDYKKKDDKDSKDDKDTKDNKDNKKR